MKKLKRILVVFILTVIVFTGYTLFINRNSVNMTVRQKVLKAVYPAWILFTKLIGKNNLALVNQHAKPPVAFHSLQSKLIDGSTFDFANLKGKKVLLVNTASDCGYTHQYEDLQALYEKYNQQLVILGFPANDFKEQEKGTDEEIAVFCKRNYGVSFPLMTKSSVKRGAAQNDVFRWLSDSTKNGWNNKQPTWNFSKYLVNEEGILTHYFDPSVSPLSDDVMNELKK